MGILIGALGTGCNDDNQQGVEQGQDEKGGTRSKELAETSYYWYEGVKIPVRKIEGKFYVVFYSKEESKIKNEFSKAGATLYDVHEIGNLSIFAAEGKEYPGVKKFTGLMAAFVEGSYEKAATALASTIYWSPFYKVNDGTVIQVTQLFTVVLKSETDLTKLEKLAKENSVEMIGVDGYNSKWYYLACTNHSEGNALEMANLFYDSGLFEAAFPDFISGQQ